MKEDGNSKIENFHNEDMEGHDSSDSEGGASNEALELTKGEKLSRRDKEEDEAMDQNIVKMAIKGDLSPNQLSN